MPTRSSPLALFPALFPALFVALCSSAPSCSCEDPSPTTGTDAPAPGPPHADAGTPPPADAPDAGVARRDCVRVTFGADLPPALAGEIEALLLRVVEDDVVFGPAPMPPAELPACGADRARLVLGADAHNPVADGVYAALAPEGFAIARADDGETIVIGVRGAPASAQRSPGGTAFGALALLEDLGFAFLHPLEPHVPRALTFERVTPRVEAPRWPVRNIHLHTSHPIELSELLNGFGPGGIDDDAGFHEERARFRAFLLWLIAGGGNEAQWLLLEAESWQEFALSAERQQRLGALVADCHAVGVACGITVPIVQHQQHSFRLITSIGDAAAEEAELRARLQWVLAAGFDFLVTSTGTTEFTHPTADKMLAWMDLTTQVAADEHGVETRMNIHVSPGQIAEPFVHRETGAPLNFNFLPTWADARLAVLPHTVQIYGLLDPAPTYGNTSFGFMREFLHEEVGRRRVMFHPETAYWVSVDVDVPLFLPVYAERRIADLQLLADDEDLGLMGRGAHTGGRMQGQDVFTSGWEWGYWLNDLVALRASWDPFRGESTPDAALVRMLAPLARALGEDGPHVVELVRALAADQRALLIHGRTGGVDPPSVERMNGLAYLAGSEAFDDLALLADRLGIAGPKTQPFRLGLVEMRNPLHRDPRYTGELEPLLAEMAATFSARAASARALLGDDDSALGSELLDGFDITALRARQVHALYDAVDLRTEPAGDMRLADARAALDAAALVVARREQRYRMPADRLAGWRDNPTAYRFMYLWTARSLWYWWRDELLAADAPLSPCVMNIIDPADVALGEGLVQTGTELLQRFSTGGLADVAACASAPLEEPSPPPRDP